MSLLAANPLPFAEPFGQARRDMDFHDTAFGNSQKNLRDLGEGRDPPLSLASYACKQAFVPLHRMKHELVSEKSSIRGGLTRVAAAVKAVGQASGSFMTFVGEKTSDLGRKSLTSELGRKSLKQKDLDAVKAASVPAPLAPSTSPSVIPAPLSAITTPTPTTSIPSTTPISVISTPAQLHASRPTVASSETEETKPAITQADEPVKVTLVGPNTVDMHQPFEIHAVTTKSSMNLSDETLKGASSMGETVLGSLADTLKVAPQGQLNFIVSLRGGLNETTGKSNLILQSQKWSWDSSKPMKTTSFKFTAPTQAGIYRGSLTILYKGNQDSEAKVAANMYFLMKVKKPKGKHWWNTVFDRFINSTTGINVAHPVFQRKISSVTKLVASITPSSWLRSGSDLSDKYRMHVLETLLTKLKNGSKNEILIAAVAIADLAQHDNVRSTLVEYGMVDPLARLVYFGEESTRAQARAALANLAFGNHAYTETVLLAMRRAFLLASYHFLVGQMASGSTSANQVSATNAVAHQMGTGYRSNNAGDGPEKTRDGKWWFPRFKSNWFGDFRSKNLYRCCECALKGERLQRCNRAVGKHCVCGQDQWIQARDEEAREMKMRQEVSQRYGGIRYEEAIALAKAESEHALKRKWTELSHHLSADEPLMKRLHTVDSPTAISAVADLQNLSSLIQLSNLRGALLEQQLLGGFKVAQMLPPSAASLLNTPLAFHCDSLGTEGLANSNGEKVMHESLILGSSLDDLPLNLEGIPLFEDITDLDLDHFVFAEDFAPLSDQAKTENHTLAGATLFLEEPSGEVDIFAVKEDTIKVDSEPQHQIEPVPLSLPDTSALSTQTA